MAGGGHRTPAKQSFSEKKRLVGAAPTGQPHGPALVLANARLDTRTFSVKRKRGAPPQSETE